MSKYTAQQIEDAIEYNAGETSSRYSGRGMYGEKCPSAKLESMSQALELIATVTAEDADMGIWMAKAAKFDQLGMGIVVYWPSVRYPKEEAA